MPTSESKTPICAYVLAEHRLAGEYLLQVLQGDSKISAVLCERFPPPLPKDSFAVFVIDTGCLSLSLRECVRRLENRFPTSKFLVATALQNDNTELAIVLRQGVQGIVEHHKVSSTLPQAVRAVARGESWITNETLQAYLALTAERRSPYSGVAHRPTAREAEIVELVRQRLTNKEIASMLGVQESTVKYHLSNVFDKLRVGNRHQLLNNSGQHQLWNDNHDGTFRKAKLV